ncbi:MAG: Fur family transcriptional regulator [Peptostreptococcaceae bacterium]|nr:Fur family transcriptional regulator [Peptostreptococcaceae bacterium]
MKMKNLHIKDISRFLVERGIKPSYQRVRILERLVENMNHPTVNDIYVDLIDEIPSLSKTTVYNTLNLFSENGIVRSFSVDGHEARYDIVSRGHGHFICLSCKEIYDFDLEEDLVIHHSLEGFETMEQDITLRGICKLCQSKKS